MGPRLYCMEASESRSVATTRITSVPTWLVATRAASEGNKGAHTGNYDYHYTVTHVYIEPCVLNPTAYR